MAGRHTVTNKPAGTKVAPPPHPAKVLQRSTPPHPAKVLQCSTPPHPAKVERAMPPHPATCDRASRDHDDSPKARFIQRARPAPRNSLADLFQGLHVQAQTSATHYRDESRRTGVRRPSTYCIAIDVTNYNRVARAAGGWGWPEC